ncbi:hypothetical protein DXX93_17445 [Thalassotalea euphylliae]|uniref:MSHA biogenesis protein MshJ n=1 Tax=Thalassotalea euphylliae TaxID=1655234 RepID=A0A3E0TW61_9GAMM|nr:type II secretion system protein GspM [Thalassotalea euphylliae]REL28172.1 hypothetical protein DXX93_17445 [Thalassotalea euphylliae]
MEQWRHYQDKFLQLTKREQIIILFAGLFLILYLGFTLFIEPNIKQTEQDRARIRDLNNSINTAQASIDIYQAALSSDPNEAVSNEIEQQKALLADIDQELLTLTSELINPVQMRIALIELLTLQPGVSLSALEVIPPSALFVASEAETAEGGEATAEPESIAASANTGNEAQTVALYRHGIKLTLTGRYNALQAYLAELEQMKWKFFWQEFELKVTEYPSNELTVTLYSLSTAKEFIGV